MNAYRLHLFISEYDIRNLNIEQYLDGKTEYSFVIDEVDFNKLINTPYGELFNQHSLSNTSRQIKKVIFNDPATIVFWQDGTKTVVKCMEGERFDPEKGLAMAISKGVLGSEFQKTFREWLPKIGVLAQADNK